MRHNLVALKYGLLPRSRILSICVFVIRIYLIHEIRHGARVFPRSFLPDYICTTANLFNMHACESHIVITE